MDLGTIRKSVAAAGWFYPVVLQAEEAGGYFVSCPAFEGCFSQGDTVEAALANIKEAIQLCAEEEVPAHIPQVSVHMVQI